MLTLDGGGIRGIISAVVINHMEQYAFKYANDTFCLGKKYSKHERVPMSNLFNLIAGTSTGSMLAAGLAVSKGPGSTENRYLAE